MSKCFQCHPITEISSDLSTYERCAEHQREYDKGYKDGLRDAYDYWKRNGKLPEPLT